MQMKNLKKTDKEVYDIIRKEEERQRDTIELIASENFVSEAVMEAVGSVLTNKYTEGYPSKRYYGGCQNYDELETLCQQRWQKVFNTNYHVNVQPHSGSSANMIAYSSVLDIGDTILAMSMAAGAHLTHSSPASFVSKNYNVVTYGIKEDGYIDYEDFYDKIIEYKPKLILAGASAYSRIINFAHMADLINRAKLDVAYDNVLNGDFEAENDEDYVTYNPYFMVDMAHIAGLIATGEHPSPFGVADIITTTTHKTLRTTRGGLIFCKPELTKKIDSAVFPRHQGGSLQHVIAGKAVGALECMSDEYKKYIHNVVVNSKVMCDEFIQMGYDVVTDGTDNHLFLIDFSKTHPNITGKMVQDILDEHGITLNKNCVPNEKRSPMQTSGVRIGTAAMTTKGYTEEDFIKVAHMIDKIINNELKGE